MKFRDTVPALVAAVLVGVGAYAALRHFDPMRLIRKPSGEADDKPSDPGKTVKAGKIPEPADDPPAASHFWLGRTEVTVGQFKRFLRESGYAYPPPLWEGPFGVRAVSPRDDDPMVNVNLRDARAFCNWLSRKEGRPYFVPTEAQWIHADEQYDCSGGVWEWCSLEGDTDELFAEKTGPEGEPAAGGRDPDIRRALRGGSRREPVDPESGGERKVLPFNARRPDAGFRVATTRATPAATVEPAGPVKTGRDGLAEQLGLSPAGGAPQAEPPWAGLPLVEIKPGR